MEILFDVVFFVFVRMDFYRKVANFFTDRLLSVYLCAFSVSAAADSV